jgi:hypothetical protein
VLATLLAVTNANFVRKRQAGGGMIEGHQILVNKYWAKTPASDKCTGTPYDSTEVDITDGMTCLTFGSLNGYYFQRVPDNATHYRRCVTDNLSCMTNANETCTVFPVALGQCFLAKTKLMEGQTMRDVELWTTTTIEKFTTIRGTTRKIAVEELYSDETCKVVQGVAKEIWPDNFNPNTTSCVPDASKKSYRAYHNSYDDKSIRVCEYAPMGANLSQSCETTPYICHVYANNKCADYPFGGSYKVYVRDAPAPPKAKSSATAMSAHIISVLLEIFAVVMMV